jgi:hypothetical protein
MNNKVGNQLPLYKIKDNTLRPITKEVTNYSLKINNIRNQNKSSKNVVGSHT